MVDTPVPPLATAAPAAAKSEWVNRLVVRLLRSDQRPLLEHTTGLVRYTSRAGAQIVLPVRVAPGPDRIVVLAGDAETSGRTVAYRSADRLSTATDSPAIPVARSLRTGLAGGQDLRGVGVEYAVVVRLALAGDDLGGRRIGLVAVGTEPVLDQPPAAVGHDCPAQRRAGLEADDQLCAPVDVARRVR